MPENEDTRFEKVKKHIVKHKVAYVAGSTGITCLFIGGVGGVALSGTDMKQVVRVKQFMGIAYKCTQTANTIIIQAKGDPGDVVMRLSDGEKWASKSELARDLGINRNLVTKYFAGKIPNLLGNQYEVIGKAGHAIPV